MSRPSLSAAGGAGGGDQGALDAQALDDINMFDLLDDNALFDDGAGMGSEWDSSWISQGDAKAGSSRAASSRSSPQTFLDQATAPTQAQAPAPGPAPAPGAKASAPAPGVGGFAVSAHSHTSAHTSARARVQPKAEPHSAENHRGRTPQPYPYAHNPPSHSYSAQYHPHQHHPHQHHPQQHQHQHHPQQHHPHHQPPSYPPAANQASTQPQHAERVIVPVYVPVNQYGQQVMPGKPQYGHGQAGHSVGPGASYSSFVIGQPGAIAHTGNNAPAHMQHVHPEYAVHQLHGPAHAMQHFVPQQPQQPQQQQQQRSQVAPHHQHSASQHQLQRSQKRHPPPPPPPPPMPAPPVQVQVPTSGHRRAVAGAGAGAGGAASTVMARGGAPSVVIAPAPGTNPDTDPTTAAARRAREKRERAASSRRRAALRESERRRRKQLHVQYLEAHLKELGQVNTRLEQLNLASEFLTLAEVPGAKEFDPELMNALSVPAGDPYIPPKAEAGEASAGETEKTGAPTGSPKKKENSDAAGESFSVHAPQPTAEGLRARLEKQLRVLYSYDRVIEDNLIDNGCLISAAAVSDVTAGAGAGAGASAGTKPPASDTAATPAARAVAPPPRVQTRRALLMQLAAQMSLTVEQRKALLRLKPRIIADATRQRILRKARALVVREMLAEASEVVRLLEIPKAAGLSDAQRSHIAAWATKRLQLTPREAPAPFPNSVPALPTGTKRPRE